MRDVLLLSLFALILSNSFVELARRQRGDGIYFKSARCNFSEKFVYQNYTCFSKSYSWTLTTLNCNIIFKKPLTAFTMQATLFYRYGLIYREVLRMPKMDWCQLMALQASNLVFKHLIELQAANFPGTVHECPYTDFVIVNRSISVWKMLTQFASGEYKSETYFHNLSNEFIGDVKFTATITTAFKENFG